MKKAQFVSIGLLLLTLPLALNYFIPAIETYIAKLENDQKIRSATILIEMKFPVAGFKTERSDLCGFGIGTLIQFQGETLLVTHNHWSLIEDATIVRFFDADNLLIKTIIGKEFRTMIAYLNPGTMILRPPQELLAYSTPVNVGNYSQVSIGDMVEVVYRDIPSGGQAAIQQAFVEKITTYQDLPVYRLRSLDGRNIQPGDSGGGIWFKSELVGNNWMVEAKSTPNSAQPEKADRVYTEISIGAALAIDGDLLGVNSPTPVAPMAANPINQADQARFGLLTTQSGNIP
jgi:hypothetical protein